MFELTVKTHFDAAHQLRNYKGKCARIHGHSWDVEVVVKGRILDSLGMLMDFNDLKRIIKSEIGRFDHSFINEVEGFSGEEGLNPTAENLAAFLFREIKEQLKAVSKDIQVDRVKVWESPNACAAYMEE